MHNLTDLYTTSPVQAKTTTTPHQKKIKTKLQTEMSASGGGRPMRAIGIEACIIATDASTARRTVGN